MTDLAIVDAYIAGWNARDADAVLATLTDDGTYQDPTLPNPVSGEAFKANMQGLWSAFPDLNFELVSKGATGPDSAAFEWMMRGTNSGSMNGLPPTGKTVEVPGADFVALRDGKIESVNGYFDGGAVPRQLGLDIIVQPSQIGPFQFGRSSSVRTGKKNPPGAFSITQLEAIDDEAVEKIRAQSRDTMIEMLQTEGFIGAVAAVIGNRMLTISAWEDADAPRQLMKEGVHVEAMGSMMRGEVANNGFTSVFVPERINPYLLRCDNCGMMHRGPEEGAKCDCGAALPDRPAYW
ncbi:MAG: ester cyclase [Pseudomonadota bacterium]